jgi:hypothetical protein
VDGHPLCNVGCIQAGVRRGEALHVQHGAVVQHGEGGVLVDGCLDVLHERQRQLTKVQCTGAPGGELPHPHPGAQVPVRQPLNQAVEDQVIHEPVRGGQREAGAAGEAGERHDRQVPVEGAHEPHHAADHRFPRGRVGHGGLRPGA